MVALLRKSRSSLVADGLLDWLAAFFGVEKNTSSSLSGISTRRRSKSESAFAEAGSSGMAGEDFTDNRKLFILHMNSTNLQIQGKCFNTASVLVITLITRIIII